MKAPELGEMVLSFLLSSLVPHSVFAQTPVTVSGKANLYAAGARFAGDGEPLVEIKVESGGSKALQVTRLSGTIGNGVTTNGPEGSRGGDRDELDRHANSSHRTGFIDRRPLPIRLSWRRSPGPIQSRDCTPRVDIHPPAPMTVHCPAQPHLKPRNGSDDAQAPPAAAASSAA